MTDEIELQRQINRAAKAQALLDNDLLKQAWDDIERDLMQAWANADSRDVVGQQLAYAAVQANRRHRAALYKYVNDGAVARKDLERIMFHQERRKKLGA